MCFLLNACRFSDCRTLLVADRKICFTGWRSGVKYSICRVCAVAVGDADYQSFFAFSTVTRRKCLVIELRAVDDVPQISAATPCRSEKDDQSTHRNAQRKRIFSIFSKRFTEEAIFVPYVYK